MFEESGFACCRSVPSKLCAYRGRPAGFRSVATTRSRTACLTRSLSGSACPGSSLGPATYRVDRCGTRWNFACQLQSLRRSGRKHADPACPRRGEANRSISARRAATTSAVMADSRPSSGMQAMAPPRPRKCAPHQIRPSAEASPRAAIFRLSARHLSAGTRAARRHIRLSSP